MPNGGVDVDDYLNDKNKHSLYVGKDYAHGFITLQDNCIISYHH